MIKKYWLHRISHVMDVSYPLLENGYLSIGFSDFSSSKFILESRNKWKVFEKYFLDIWEYLPKSRYTLWRFISEMKKGDWIIIPSWGNFNIYEITDDKVYLPIEINTESILSWDNLSIIKSDDGKINYNNKSKELIDLGFLRKVKTICDDIPRSKYADSSLTARLKARQTNLNISDLKDSILSSLEAFKLEKPINIQSQLIEESLEPMVKIIKRSLNPDKFERLIKKYFDNIGATKTEIPSKNERDKLGDADIISTFESLKTIFYVQAKFHTGKTGKFALNQIDEYVQYKKESLDDDYTKTPWVITTADSFTEESIEIGKRLNIQLLDIRTFVKMILESGISNFGDI